MMTPPSQRTAHALVLADIPERQELRRLQGLLSAKRDEIAELNLEIESLRDALQDFESQYHERLASEHADLQRIERLVRHIERWRELLSAAPRVSVAQRGKRVEQRRQRELSRQAEQRQRATAPRAQPEPDVGVAAPADRLKTAYRALARRYHPDLAGSERERVEFGQRMRRINALYRLGDVERLEAWAEQAKGGELDAPDLDEQAQISLLQQRREWFETVLQNLREEREDLERSPTCQLMRNVAQARQSGRDLLEELRGELQRRVADAFGDVRTAIRDLEAEVSRYNRDAAHSEAVEAHATERQALKPTFDPFADKSLVRLGLAELATLNTDAQSADLGAWMTGLVETHPATLRLILFAYVSELTPFPLPGLEHYDDLATRFQHLSQPTEPRIALEEALVDTDEVLEFGVKRATAKVAYTGLRFRSEKAREAVLVALKDMSVRREFRRVLMVLGELETCPSCGRQDFVIPVFKLRGLDDLRASVCGHCGAVLNSYWMPAGQDVQAVLNAAFLDFDIVSEWSFSIARTSIATQLLPIQVDSWNVGNLKRRLYDDVFKRNDLDIKRSQIQLFQGGRRIPEKTALIDVEGTQFHVRFTNDAPCREAEALEMLRHRIRNRFRA